MKQSKSENSTQSKPKIEFVIESYPDDPTKKLYAGVKINKLRYGEGIHFYRDGGKSYKGQWGKNKRHGHGTQYYPYSGHILHEGQWQNDIREGYGQVYHSNGKQRFTGIWKSDKIIEGTLYNLKGLRQYHGKVYKNKAHGLGQLFYKTGQISYEGEFHKDLFHGKGKQQTPSGKIFYEGEYSEGKKHGLGIVYHSDTGEKHLEGKFCEGQFKNGRLYFDGILNYEGGFDGCAKRKGYGVQYENGKKIYEGNWVNDKYQGSGKSYFELKNLEKVEYDGQWINNKRSGIGKSFWGNGKVKYEGQWKRGQKTGKGKAFFENGFKEYIGEWKAGKKSGIGFLYSSGSINTIEYEGEFKFDKKHGFGTSYYKNGKGKYVGDWAQGLKNGKGHLYDLNGSIIYTGKWKHGERTFEENMVGLADIIKNKLKFDNGNEMVFGSLPTSSELMDLFVDKGLKKTKSEKFVGMNMYFEKSGSYEISLDKNDKQFCEGVKCWTSDGNLNGKARN